MALPHVHTTQARSSELCWHYKSTWSTPCNANRQMHYTTDTSACLAGWAPRNLVVARWSVLFTGWLAPKHCLILTVQCKAHLIIVYPFFQFETVYNLLVFRHLVTHLTTETYSEHILKEHCAQGNLHQGCGHLGSNPVPLTTWNNGISSSVPYIRNSYIMTHNDDLLRRYSCM